MMGAIVPSPLEVPPVAEPTPADPRPRPVPPVALPDRAGLGSPLPAPSTSFVGSAREVAGVCALFQDVAGARALADEVTVGTTDA